jgi:hypothetical protein
MARILRAGVTRKDSRLFAVHLLEAHHVGGGSLSCCSSPRPMSVAAAAVAHSKKLRLVSDGACRGPVFV